MIPYYSCTTIKPLKPLCCFDLFPNSKVIHTFMQNVEVLWEERVGIHNQISSYVQKHLTEVEQDCPLHSEMVKKEMFSLNTTTGT